MMVLIFLFLTSVSLQAQTPYRVSLDNVTMVNMRILDSTLDIEVDATGNSSGIFGVEIRFSRVGHRPAEEILKSLDISNVNSQKLVLNVIDERTIQIRFPQLATFHTRMMIRTRDGSSLRDLFNRLHGGKVVMVTMSPPYNAPCPPQLTAERWDEFH